MRPYMKRIALYSSSRRPQSPVPRQTEGNDYTPESATRGPAGPFFLFHFIQRRDHIYWVVVGGLVTLLIGGGLILMTPAPRRITQKDVDRAVLYTLETQALPSPAARAYEIIKPSVVRVRGLEIDPKGGGEIEE